MPTTYRLILFIAAMFAAIWPIAAHEEVRFPNEVSEYLVEARQCRVALFQAQPDALKRTIHIKALREKHCGKDFYERGLAFMERYANNADARASLYEEMVEFHEASRPCPKNKAKKRK
jgi:hypothetical protein